MDLRPLAHEKSGAGGTSSSGNVAAAAGTAPFSSSAPSTFSSFHQFQQQQQSLDESAQRRSASNSPHEHSERQAKSGSDAVQHDAEARRGDVVSLTSRLNAFRLKNVGCDVAFVVGEEREQLKAHKLVLGASSPVFYAMFYGPLGSSFVSTGTAPVLPTIVHQAPSERSASMQSNQCASAVVSPVPPPSGEESALAAEEYDEEEYEEDEYEEAEEREEADNLSTGGNSTSFSNSLSSSLEGEHHLGGQKANIAAANGHGGTTVRNTCAAKEALHHQQFPFEGKRRLSNGFHVQHCASHAKLGHKTVQAAEEEKAQDQWAHLRAQGLQVICAPDCEPKAFGVLLDFVYSDFDVGALSERGQLNDDNVMNTLYAAKKYAIDALVVECVRYCTARLTATNAVSLLAQARMFDENTLVEKCYQMIDRNTDVALQAANVADIDRDTLIKVLGRSQLDPSSELVIFHAAKAWAEAECSRRGTEVNVHNLRQCLGPAMQLIRFSLMDVNEFGQAASSSLLTCEEIAEVFLHLTVRPRPQCRFAARGFRANSRSKHIVQRFSALSSKRCTRRENKICFTADKDVLISGLTIYGVNQAGSRMITEESTAKTSWEHKVAIKLELVADLYGSPLEMLASNEVLLSGKIGDPTPFLAQFVEPVLCHGNTTYLVTARFMTEEGVSTFQGKEGQAVVAVELPFDQTVRFKFQAWRNGLWNDDGGRTEGQIPALHFLVQWPEETQGAA